MRMILPAGVVALTVALYGVGTAGAGVVADPFRAADVRWPTHELKGRTWRYLLDPASFTLDGLKDEAFVQDAGVYPLCPIGTLRDARADTMFGFSDDPDEKRFVVGEPAIPDAVRPRLRDYPFELYEGSRCIMGLKPDECDLRVYDRFVKEYPDTYLGCCFGEWNSRVIYFLPRKQSAHYKDFVREFPMPCSRDQFYLNFLSYWDMGAGQKGPRAWGLSGPCNLAAIGCERGSTVAAVEITCERSWRELMMFTCGAGRQFDLPLQYYIAFFRGGFTCDTRPGQGANMGEDWGIPPNLAYRTVMLGYYQGCNYQTFECFPWGFVREVKSEEGRVKSGEKTVELTGNGRAAKRAYDFIRSPAGARGTFYAPILLLADRAHGHDGLSGSPSVATGRGPFANEYPPTAADQFMEDVLSLLDNNTRLEAEQDQRMRRDKSTPIAEYQFGLYNSPFADIFDVAIANPATPGKELRADQLAKYPVVISLGGIQWTDALKKKVADYVEAGGTFVYPQGEQELIGKSGRGNVVAMPREREAMKAMLLQLQKEVLPVQYSGECETVWNAMPDGSWRVCVVNHAGVFKKANETQETFHGAYAKTVSFRLPRGASARELVTGAEGGEIVVPPGEVRVLEIRGVERHTKRFEAKAKSEGEGPKKPSRLTPPLEFPLEFKKHGIDNELCVIREDWETDELTIEVMAKPKPKDYWVEKGRKERHPLQGGVFGVCGHVYPMFSLIWLDGEWWMRRGGRKSSWIRGPKADPDRYTKLAVTLKDSYLHFFVDDKEVFGETGPTFWPKVTAKDLFNHCFCFHRGSDTFMDSAKHSFLGEAKDYRAFSKAIYPLRFEVKAKGEGEDATAEIQKTIDAAVEKTGEVVLGKGVYKVSQLQLRTGVTLHIEEGASIVNLNLQPQPLLLAKDITDFTILGPGTIKGGVLFENVGRACVRGLRMDKGTLAVRGSKNIVTEECTGVTIAAQASSRILVDGQLQK